MMMTSVDGDSDGDDDGDDDDNDGGPFTDTFTVFAIIF